MLSGIAIILGLQLLGEVIVNALNWPIPGPVLGMIFLFTFLLFYKRVPGPLEKTAEGILSHLSLLYVPAGVGVVQYLSVLRTGGLSIFAAIIISTVLGLVATGWALQLLLRNDLEEEENHED